MSSEAPRPRAFEGPRRLPWRAAHRVEDVVAAWQQDARLWRHVTLCEHVPTRAAQQCALPEGLGAGVVTALRGRGITGLYSHQREAFEACAAGQDVVVATPTASGKSLCFNLPVLDALSACREARALYLFPTKALSRDQEQALSSLMRDAGLSHAAITYDGDTPGDARRVARERSGVLLTNPDMLHAGILPHHAQWARLFAHLRYVVIDELHTYRGIFGSHLANVIRRLDRVARFHGSEPVYVFASATIGNPEEHASRMRGGSVRLIAESGAPAGAKSVLVYNPPVVHSELGIRASYVKTAVRLTADLVRAGVSTLVFGQSRNSVEVMLKYLRARVQRDQIDPSSIQAYRGGYLPGTRRRIEAGLRDGAVQCVIATNALELGIDIGALDAVVCAGYPGSMAALWQRFGRGGRRHDHSLALLVTSSAPLDQYVAQHAGQVVGAPIEQARIDPDNVEILLQHIKCAAFELPFVEGEGLGALPCDTVDEALRFLSDHRLVHASTGATGKRTYHWVSDAYPAHHVSLRSAGWDNFVIIDMERDRAIAEMDWRATHTMLHEQAIYQHEGEQYQVERLDFENHKAFVRPVASDYFTDAITHTAVAVLEEEAQASEPAEPTTAAGLLPPLYVARGEVSVVEKVVGYKKIKYFTHENVGYGDVRLPEMQMHTTAFWVTVPEAVVQAQPVARPEVIDALRGLAHAMHTVAALGLMVDRRDLGHALGDRGEDEPLPSAGAQQGARFDPTLFLYDHVPGGIGLAARLFDERQALLYRTRQLIEGCGCVSGCPACTGPLAGEAPGVAVGPRRIVLDLLASIGMGPSH